MTSANDILRDGFDRVHGLVPTVVDGLGVEELLWRPDPDANSIAWLVWHLTRVQDDHLAGVAGAEQVYTSAGWHDRLGLPYDPAAIGYGQSSEEVGAFVLADPAYLTGYHEQVHATTSAVLDALDDAALERVVDASFDPPVTAAVRLVSVLNDTAQHVGQAAYVRGLVERR
jgi:hypothetical protein